MPLRHPHSEQRRPARAHAVGLVLGPHARAHRSRDTQVADLNGPPSGRAVGGGGASDLRRPSQRWKAAPPGTPFRQPHSEQRRAARAHAVVLMLGPHARTNRTRDTRVADPNGPPHGRAVGGGAASDLRGPSQRWKAPPPGTPFRQPHSEERRPARAHAVGPVQLGPHARTDRTRDTRVADPNGPPSGRAVGGGGASDLRRPSQRWKAPPPGTPFRHPHSEQRRPARAHAVEPVQLGPHARTDRTRDTRVADPNGPPSGRAFGGGGASDLRRPSQRWKAPPPGDAVRPAPRRATPARKGAGCGAGAAGDAFPWGGGHGTLR